MAKQLPHGGELQPAQPDREVQRLQEGVVPMGGAAWAVMTASRSRSRDRTGPARPAPAVCQTGSRCLQPHICVSRPTGAGRWIHRRTAG